VTPPSPSSPAATIEGGTLFADTRRKTVKSLNGIEVDLVVSVHELEGNIIIEGEVPDTALVIVKQGSLVVNGYVNGCVVAEKGVEVKGNITGGYVLSPRGNIKAQSALSGSHIIAVTGSLKLEGAENPACVFAWQGIDVAKDVIGGRFLAAKITIGGKACGGELHATGAIEVGSVEMPAHGGMLVCLRNEITCEEFGRPMGQDERKLRRSIGKHHYQRATTARLLRYAERDTQDSHLTFLYMLLCGRLDAQKMSTMRGLQAQSNFLAEISAVCEQLVSFFTDAWKQPEQSAEEYEPLAETCVSSLTAVAEDAVVMANAFRLQHKPYISSACDDLTKTINSLKRQPITRATSMSLVAKFKDRRARCDEMRVEMSAHLEEAISGMGLDADVARSVEAQPHKAEAMVETVCKQLEKDSNNPRYPRVRSPLARLLKNTVDRSQKNITHWKAMLAESDAQLKEIHGRLGASATSLFAADTPGSTYLQCGSCHAGVTLVGAPRDGTAPLETATCQITLATAVTTPVRYQLAGSEIQRRAAS
jgi:hypothetical protein